MASSFPSILIEAAVVVCMVSAACGGVRSAGDGAMGGGPPPPGDACKLPPGSLGVPKRADTRKAPPPPTAGQMTEMAANAKRLFDGERWSLAEIALAEIAHGDAGDDEGNKQLAIYHRAIALFRLGRSSESAELFRAIAARPNHLKFNETILWLAKMVSEHPNDFRFADLANYGPEQVMKFDNANQRELFWRLAYLVGRARYDQGDMATAATLFEAAENPSSPWASYAKQCRAAALPERR